MGNHSDPRLDRGNTQSLTRVMLRVALPVAAQGLITSSLNLVDNLIVASLGETELAAVGLSSQVFFVHWMTLFGFTSGAAAFMAQFWGRRDLLNVRRTVGIVTVVNLCVSTVFFLPALLAPARVLSVFTNIPEVIEMGSGFIRINAPTFLLVSLSVPMSAALRATQQTHLPLKISIAVFSLNTFLNYVFVFGNFGAPALGVRGAAVATVSARCLELVLVLLVVFAGKNILAGPVREFFSKSRGLFRRVLAQSLPTAANEVLWSAGTSMYNAAYGRLGTTAFAAVQAGGTILNIFLLACFSLGDASLIIIGERLGRGEKDEAVVIAGKILRVCVVAGLIAGACLFVTSGFVVGLFTKLTPLGVSYTRAILAVYSGLFFVKLLNAVFVTGILRCGGDAKFAMLGEVGCVWFLGVPTAFLGALYFHWPVWVVVLVVQAEEVLKLAVMFWRFLSRKWVRNLVREIE